MFLPRVVLIVMCILFLLKESIYTKKHFIIAFIIFLLAESIVFFTLFYLVLSTLPDEARQVVPLSE